MLVDVVADTNVLVDAGNPGSIRFECSVELLTRLLNSDTVLKIDPQSKSLTSTRAGHIMTEYLDNLHHGSFGFSVLSALASAKRILEINELPSYSVKRKVNQMIRNKVDRIFLCVSIKSQEKILVSHDYNDFQQPKRVNIRRKFGVRVIEAGPCKDLL